MQFSSFELNPKLLKAVEDQGFEVPTPIQEMAIPPLMEGRDVLAAAATGSGKTAAFVLPILHKLMEKPRGKTRALVLAPTRELAAQIAEHLKALAAHTQIKGAAVYGGVGMEPQVAAFKRGVDVIIATPGRLLDHFQYPYARLDSLEFLVLDEADRMLDMGFLPDVRRVLKQLPAGRQTILCSATLPLPIVELAREMLDNPVALNVERKSAPAEGITHAAYPVPHELKSHLLLELLKRPEASSVLAFTRTKHRANRLADFLEKRGVSCARIHGSRSQAQRTEALAGFKAGRYKVLVATDIAARGIDVQALGLVVNFDVPNLPEDYIHRVGRTARADATGDAYTLVSPQEEAEFREIERHLGKKLPRQTVEGFDYTRKAEERFEVPLAERIAVIRARKAEERARAKAKLQRRSGQETQGKSPAGSRRPSSQRPGRPVKGGKPDRAPREVDGNRLVPESQGTPREIDGNRAPQPAHAAKPAGAGKHNGRHASGGGRPFQGGRRQAPPPQGQDGRRQSRPQGGAQPKAGPADGKGQERRGNGRDGRERKRNGGRPQDIPAGSPRKGSFTFIRSSRFVEEGGSASLPDTSGVREDIYQTHRDGLAGRSNWGKAWQQKAGTSQPDQTEQQD